MEIEQLAELVKNEDIFVDLPSFYQLAFTLIAHQRKLQPFNESDAFKRLLMEEYNTISNRLDKTGFQESCSARNVLRTRRLATLLIDDKGELDLAVLPHLMELQKRYLFSLGPNRQFDAKYHKHIYNVLYKLHNDKELVRLLKSIDKPVSHKYADQMVRDTLCLSAGTPITDAHVRRAVLSAWLCTLRQSVGSCFATAPAIIIHDDQPKLFLTDVRDLLNTGRMKRTYGGVEYAVPLSASWGAGDLKKPFYVPLGEVFENSGLWLSPGLVAAFEASGILEAEASSTTKQKQIKALLIDLFSSLASDQSYVVITAEEIIKKILLKHLKLTEKDLHDYENRPKGMMQTSLVMQMPAGASGGKAEQYIAYQTRLKAAESSFKGLTDNALLKGWEFSLASLSETKAQFGRWNLYSSLGLGAQEQGGIGACIFTIIKNKVDQANQRVQDFQFEYEQVYNQLKTMEVRMRNASTEKEGQWLKVEYQSRRNEFYTLEEMRDEINQKAHRLANLYDHLIDAYDSLFPRYFQEVYDADMHDVSSGPYDDSPAGFRLLYKHGRSNTSQWTYIRTPSEFIETLVSFFTATETEIAASQQFEGLQTDLSEIITAVVMHVRTVEFLNTAFNRMAAAHNTRMIKDPLEHLDQIDKKPWAYTSGGTMDTLVSCYYKLEQKPAEIGRWVESPTELFVFLIDTIKQIPAKLMKDYGDDENKKMLIHSPTHAFILKPGVKPFRDAWKQNDGLTYIWVRDNIIAPRKKLLEKCWLSEEMKQYLVERLAQFVPEDYRHYFKRTFAQINGNMRPIHFREYILKNIHKERSLKAIGSGFIEDEIDKMLYIHLPLFQREELRQKVENIFNAIPSIAKPMCKKLMQIFDITSQPSAYQPIVDAAVLQNICKGILCLGLEATSFEVDYHALVSRAAQQLGYALPAPVVFADTNWVKEEFGFVLNPGTERLELWRVDAIGRAGFPMSAWEQWLNGSRKDRTWGVYVKPYEYGE